jgi:hypothetical protein
MNHARMVRFYYLQSSMFILPRCLHWRSWSILIALHLKLSFLIFINSRGYNIYTCTVAFVSGLILVSVTAIPVRDQLLHALTSRANVLWQIFI